MAGNKTQEKILQKITYSVTPSYFDLNVNSEVRYHIRLNTRGKLYHIRTILYTVKDNDKNN